MLCSNGHNIKYIKYHIYLNILQLELLSSPAPDLVGVDLVPVDEGWGLPGSGRQDGGRVGRLRDASLVDGARAELNLVAL